MWGFIMVSSRTVLSEPIWNNRPSYQIPIFCQVLNITTGPHKQMSKSSTNLSDISKNERLQILIRIYSRQDQCLSRGIAKDIGNLNNNNNQKYINSNNFTLKHSLKRFKLTKAKEIIGTCSSNILFVRNLIKSPLRRLRTLLKINILFN